MPTASSAANPSPGRSDVALSATAPSIAPSSSISDPAGDFATAMAAGEVDRALLLLDDDIVFHSPVVHRSYRGREAVADILRAVSVVFEDFAYTGRYDSADGAVLAFSARVGDRALEGVDIIRIGGDGRMAELTVMVRPLSATTALRDRMAAMLAGDAPPAP